MWNFNEVKSLSYRGGHVFHIIFDDGTSGELDFKEYVGRGPVFEPLRDPAFFQRARVENGTISWPNGADIAPETLYEKLIASKAEPTTGS
jgi:hypothetical protein